MDFVTATSPDSTQGGIPLLSITLDGNDTTIPIGQLPDLAAVTPQDMEGWARAEYNKAYCDGSGKQKKPLDLELFTKDLVKKRPGNVDQIHEVVERLDVEITEDICKQFPMDKHGNFVDYTAVIHRLHKMRPDLAKQMMIGRVIAEIEKRHAAACDSAKLPPANTPHTSDGGKRSRSDSQSQSNSTVNITNGPLLRHQPAAGSGSPTKKQSKKKGMTAVEVEQFVHKEFIRQYHNSSGTQLKRVPDVQDFTQSLQNSLKGYDTAIAQAVKTLDNELANKPLNVQDSSVILSLAQLECEKLVWTDTNREQNRMNIIKSVNKKRPDIHSKVIEEQVLRAEALHITRTHQTATINTQSKTNFTTTGTNRKLERREIEQWVHQQFMDHGFDNNGFKGYKWLSTHLQNSSRYNKDTVVGTMYKLRYGDPNYVYAFGNVDKIFANKKATAQQSKDICTMNWREPTLNKDSFTKASSSVSLRNSPIQEIIADSVVMPDAPPPSSGTMVSQTVLLARKLSQHYLSEKPDDSTNLDTSKALNDTSNVLDRPVMSTQNQNTDDQTLNTPADPQDMMILLSDGSENWENEEKDMKNCDTEIRHAPLLDEEFISDDYKHLVPQYGLIGSHDEFTEKSKFFLNTNVPFSAFICGVQGSGKSHLASCILENVLIQNALIGKLQNPLSALVFSYGQFSGDGAGYNICEAAFLAAPHAKFPGGARVNKVNVLVSPSNYVRMSKLYTRIPNVSVTPFKLKPWNLDIDIMLTLMNVNESGDPPLYMAQVTQILRGMAATGAPFNYLSFKENLKRQNFNPVQINMLQMRLNLLESFLDLQNTCPAPQFRPSEITIMDMSCPFVDVNTACILFRIGLQSYLKSESLGKTILLDEAHKYMLNVPGAKSLNETLLQTIRLQRHYGARVIVSTQEPTVLADLIALCSITFVHRFSSPQWLAAIRKHIPMSPQAAQALMNKIESLKTGTALVYCPNAILGWDDDEKTLFKGTGKMIKVSIRKRITCDGGQSLLAV